MIKLLIMGVKTLKSYKRIVLSYFRVDLGIITVYENQISRFHLKAWFFSLGVICSHNSQSAIASAQASIGISADQDLTTRISSNCLQFTS